MLTKCSLNAESRNGYSVKRVALEEIGIWIHKNGVL